MIINGVGMVCQNNKIFKLIKLLWRAYGQYKFGIMFLAFLSFVNSLLEGIGVTAIIPIFSFIIKTQNKSDDLATKLIEKIFSHLHLNFSLRYLLVFVGFLLLAKVMVLFLVNYLAAKMAADFEEKTRNELLAATFRAEWPYLSNQKIGYLDQILTTNVIYSSNLLLNINTFLLFVAQIAIYTLVAINISVIVTLLVLLVGFFIFFIFKKYFYLTKVIGSNIESLYKTIGHFINESVIGLKTIKSMFIEDEVATTGRYFFSQLKKSTIQATISRSITSIFIQPVGLLFVMGVFAYLYKATDFNFASFAVLIFAISRIFTQIQIGQTQLHGIVGLVPFLQNVMWYGKIMKEHKETTGGKDNFKLEHSLEFRNVSFSYEGRQGVIINTSFIIKKGEITGLIGPSGAGKTTLADLCLRLMNPVGGQILLDEKDAKEIDLRQWRKNIGYVSQDSLLINDTIKTNIRFYDNTISEKNIVEAAKAANIFDFIESLPNTFATMVGERGLALSAGQRQRIMLARILARHPQVLILDEATSALDNESEALIRKAIYGLRGSVTVLIIAHRLSTIINCDKLLVLDAGKIIEQGSPKDLISDQSSYFYKVYNIKDNSISKY